MKNLSRSAVALAFAVALLAALPAHAAAPHRAHATPTNSSVAARLGSAWTQLVRFFAATTDQPTAGGNRATVTDLPNSGRQATTNGGSCIDPDGSCSAN